MTKRFRGYQKVLGGYKWTRSGFVKQPDWFRSVSISALPLAEHNKAKTTPLKRKKAKPQPETRLGVKATEKARRRLTADSAPTLAGDTAKRMQPPPRAAWRGKYDGLSPPEQDQDRE